MQPQRMKLAMRADACYHVEDIHVCHWQRWAKRAGLGETMIVDAIAAMAAALPEALAATAAAMRGEGLAHPVVDRLEAMLTARAVRIAGMVG